MNILLIIFILFILSTMIYFVAKAYFSNPCDKKAATSNIATWKITDNGKCVASTCTTGNGCDKSGTPCTSGDPCTKYNEYKVVLGGGGYGYCDSKNIISTTKGTKYDDCSKLCDSKCNGYDWDSNGPICHTYSDKPVKTVGKPYTASCFSKI